MLQEMIFTIIDPNGRENEKSYENASKTRLKVTHLAKVRVR
jgi:hypothetical protein